MSQDDHPRSDRVKFVYNAQFPAATAIVLNYLLNNPHFTGRQGRQQGMDAMMAFYRPLAEEFHGELSVSEIQEMARHCVERLAKQIADLCDGQRPAQRANATILPIQRPTAPLHPPETSSVWKLFSNSVSPGLLMPCSLVRQFLGLRLRLTLSRG